MRSLLLLLVALLSFGLAEPVSSAPPNILIVLVDDMGFSDLGCFGGEIPTPHLDALAERGVKFTQFYNAARCCPTRASLLTGLYPHQAGMGNMNQDEGLPAYRGYLNDRCVTIAEVLRTAGYFTAITGKWHVGDGDLARLPLQRGFDRFYGTPEGGGFYFTPLPDRSVVMGNEVLYDGKRPAPADWYSTDAWTDYGLRFIDEAKAAGKPFFLYLAHNAPHYPLQAPQADIAKFRGRYNAGWDALRAQRLARQHRLGLASPPWQLSSRDDSVAAWDSLSEGEKDEQDLQMAIYAAVMHRLDESIGRLVAGLKERNAFENTLILFLSDNGASAEGGPLGTSERRYKRGTPGAADSFINLSLGWANASNTPFRKYKRRCHEGGIATPFIAHWPVGIKESGRIEHTPAHIIDIMATCGDLAGAAYPAEHRGKPVTPMEGRSLRPFFTTANHNAPSRLLFWEHEHTAAIRSGHWKLVRAGLDSPWELYDLENDRAETRDLASSHPERVLQMEKEWEAWAERVQVKPYPSAKP